MIFSRLIRSSFFWPLLLAFLTAGTSFIGHHLNPPLDALSTPFIKDAWAQKQGSESIAILFTGDIMLDRYIKTLRDRNGGDFPFTYMPQILSAVQEELNVNELDLVVGNLEGPITDSDYINNGTAMIFNFEPAVADLLKRAGFTTLSMANNHSFDMGKEGLKETHDHLATVGIDGFGHPDTPNGEFSFLRYDFEETSIGFLGLNDAVIPLNLDAALSKIRELDPEVDFLIVGIHWGFEYETLARESVVNQAHEFIDAGADFIWGHHPHVVQNSEVYNGKNIYYSLGNFVFDQYWTSATQEGLVLGLKMENGELSVIEQMVDLVEKGAPKPREN